MALNFLLDWAVTGLAISTGYGVSWSGHSWSLRLSGGELPVEPRTEALVLDGLPCRRPKGDMAPLLVLSAHILD